MARPFTPRDSLGLRKLQASGTSLELENVVLTNESPLRQALSSCLPFSASGIETLVEADPVTGELEGFVQVRRRKDNREADLVFIAPGLGCEAGADRLWLRLIDAASLCLGRKGCQRFHARIDEDDRRALQLLRQLNFAVHASDTVFRRPAGQTLPRLGSLPPVIRNWEPLCDGIAALARQAMTWAERARDGSQASQWLLEPMGGWAPGPALGRVWLDEAGRTLGAWRAICGRAGIWLCALVAPNADASALVAHALTEIAAAGWPTERPLYAVARGQEPDLNLAYREAGFEPIMGRFWLARPTTVRLEVPVVQKPAWQKAGFEAAPGTSCRAVRR